MQDQLNDARTKLETARKEIEDMIRGVFKDEASVLFSKYPKLNKFAWVQYTPWFNDGETCYFGAHIDETTWNEDVDNNKWEPSEHFWSYGNWQDGKGYTRHPAPGHEETFEMAEDINQFLHLFTEDDLKFMFGDHVRVIVSRDGVKTEDYDHD